MSRAKNVVEGVVDLFGTGTTGASARVIPPIIPAVRSAGVQLDLRTDAALLKFPNVTGEASKAGHVACALEDIGPFIERLTAGAAGAEGRPLQVAAATLTFDNEGNASFRLANGSRARSVEIAASEVGAFAAFLRNVAAVAQAARTKAAGAETQG